MKLPFPFDAAEFLPLQPEDAAREKELRLDTRFAHLYANRAEQLYAEQAESAVTPVNEYAAWKEACAGMDKEAEDARLKWREAIAFRDTETVRLHNAVEQARLEWKTLASRPKPPQPRSARKG